MRDASRGAAAGVFLAVTALTAGPPLAALPEQGTLAIFRQLAADAFYYLAVADRSAGAAFFTFDGVHPTNGFHPLWQWLLTGSFGALELAPEAQLGFVFAASAVLVSLGTGLFAVAVLHHTGRPALALLASTPGFFFAVVAALNPHTGSPWSYVNGMESPLSIFCFGILACSWLGTRWLGPAATTSRLLLSSLGITLITLSRLDDVFLFAPFLLLVWGTASSAREGLRRAALASLIPGVAIGAYLAYNAVVAGSLLPSSGVAKTQPLWGLVRNGYALLTTLAPFADVRDGPDVWASEAWRLLQMVLPAGLAGAWLATRPFPRVRGERDPARWRNAPLAVLAGYVVLKGTYNFAMVSLWDQGEWYYPLSVLSANLLLAALIGDALDRRTEATPPAAAGSRLARSAIALAAALALSASTGLAFAARERQSDRHVRNHRFWQERANTRARLEAACPGCGVLAFDDGIVAYTLEGTPTLNGLGLAMDAEAQRALREGRLLELAWSRGHRLLVSVNYPMPEAAYADAESLSRHLATNRYLEREDLSNWRFEPAFRTREADVPFVRFRPREPTR